MKDRYRTGNRGKMALTSAFSIKTYGVTKKHMQRTKDKGSKNSTTR